jgi:hypothetical protein
VILKISIAPTTEAKLFAAKPYFGKDRGVMCAGLLMVMLLKHVLNK